MERLNLSMLSGVILLTIIALTGAPAVDAANIVTVLNAEGCTGDTIVVTVNLQNNSTVVDAWGFHLRYNSSHLDYVSCEPGVLDPGWYTWGCDENTPGDIVIGAYATTSSIPLNSNDSLVLLTFNVTCGSCMPGVTSQLTIDTMVDDLAALGPGQGQAVPGTFTYRCPTNTPTPAPTNTPTRTPTGTPTSGATATPAPIPAMSDFGSILLLALLGLIIIARRK